MSKTAAFQISSGSQTAPVPMKIIRSIVQHIAQRFDPAQIILFGSHAYGKPTAESDADLLVVMDKPLDEMETMVEISKLLPIIAFGVDVIVHSRKTLERRKKLGDWFCSKSPGREKSYMNEPTKEWVAKSDGAHQQYQRSFTDESELQSRWDTLS